MKVIVLSLFITLISIVSFAQTKPKSVTKTIFSIIGCWSATGVSDGSEYHFYADKHFSLIAPTKTVRGKYEYVGNIVILHYENEYGKPDHDETLRLANYGNTKLLGYTTTVTNTKDFFAKGRCTY